ncbi:thap domain [Holotrichia oblita]|uniref:Thap domain n=1 Tax=Holotrichia oblita TaxID=644536 RepID=A0ACB9TYS2_HOLOL|nr:thap domain [Holotrichia oblita]
MCKSSTVKTPDKKCITIPRDVTIRKQWFTAMRRDVPLSEKTTGYCCTDHFDHHVVVSNYLVQATVSLPSGAVKLFGNTRTSTGNESVSLFLYHGTDISLPTVSCSIPFSGRDMFVINDKPKLRNNDRAGSIDYVSKEYPDEANNHTNTGENRANNVQSFLEMNRKSQTQPLRKKKKKIDVLPGQSVVDSGSRSESNNILCTEKEQDIENFHEKPGRSTKY